MSKATILIIEPSPDHSRYIGELLQVMGHRPSIINDVQYLDDYMEMVRPDIIIISEEVYKRYTREVADASTLLKGDTAVILLGKNKESSSMAYDGYGCTAHLPRNMMPLKLKQVLDETLGMKKVVLNSEEPIILGHSNEMVKLRILVRRLADSNLTVLIRGESGTGKELVARSIHYHSRRRNQPFIKVNSGSIPEGLIESELFGYDKGSFTGAFKDKAGMFELAREGTIFLDEIGELSIASQATLLQVLQDNEFFKLGGVKNTRVDGRVLAATNADLEEMVEAGSFRSDLYYRLNVAAVNVPPLRKRKEDILLLAKHFLRECYQKHNKKYQKLHPRTLAFFQNYSWPGNVRELKNIIHNIVLMENEGDALASLNHYALDKAEKGNMWSLPVREGSAERPVQFKNRRPSLKEITRKEVEEAELQALLEALNYTGWNRKKTAQMLEISYKSLLNKISHYRLKERTYGYEA